MNAVVTILQTFDLETRGEAVCRVEAGTTFGATVEGVRVEDVTKRLHKVRFPVESELIEITMNAKQDEKAKRN